MAKKNEICDISQKVYNDYIQSKTYEEMNVLQQNPNMDNSSLYVKLLSTHNPSINLQEIIDDISFENLKISINTKPFIVDNKYHINDNFDKSLKNILKAFCIWSEILKTSGENYLLEFNYSKPLINICSKILVFMYSHYIYDEKSFYF